jgi:hypothetical protein
MGSGELRCQSRLCRLYFHFHQQGWNMHHHRPLIQYLKNQSNLDMALRHFDNHHYHRQMINHRVNKQGQQHILYHHRHHQPHIEFVTQK